MAKRYTACLPVRILAALSLLAAAAGCRRRAVPPAEPVGKENATETLPAEITTPLGIEMVLVPGGQFLMGSEAQVDTAPVHRVSVTSFYMDRYEVTQEVYQKVMGQNPSRRKGKANPVERVRWLDAIKFCNARSLQEGLEPCYDVPARECRLEANGYRLPTEAEWEYACRAGTTGDYPFGNDAGNLDAHGWFRGNARRRHHPVGQKEPNPFSLHDMTGNVWEWCDDWYQVDYYGASPSADPIGPAAGEKKVLRGGAFSSSAASCSSWVRYCDEPGFTDACVASDDYGFRCVRRAGR